MAEPTVQTRLIPTKGRGVLEPTEEEFMAAVISAMRLFGWTRIAHFRPARTGKGWRTPMVGDIGFPDIIAIRGATLLAVELKARGQKPRPEQIAWLEAFDRVPGCRAAVWTTRDPWSGIEAALRDL